MLREFGPKYSVAMARWSGANDAEKQWDSKQFAKIRIKFSVRFKSLCQFGKIPSPEQRRLIRDGIWEYKADVMNVCWRAMAFEENGTWFVTHFFITDHRTNMINREFKKACIARDEHRAAAGG